MALAPLVTFNVLVLLYGRLVICAQVAQPQLQQQQQSSCLNQTCGGITVSYPFKLQNATGCPSYSSSFELECDPHTGYLLFNKAAATSGLMSLSVLALAADSIALDVTSTIVAMKLTPNGTYCDAVFKTLILPSFPSPYLFSDENKFSGFGCAFAMLITADPSGNNSVSLNSTSGIKDVAAGGCDVLCPGGDNNPECGNNKCCVFRWPRGSFPRMAVYGALRSFISAATYDLETCSSNYATLFHPDYTNFHSQKYGIKLMWALPSNHTTSLGILQSPEYACSNHSYISLVQDVPGYLCYCLPGYSGDGYAQGTECSDIDECKGVAQNDCIQGQTTCSNTDGNYNCHCKSPFQVGDGRKSGSGCYFSPTIRNAIVISTSILGLIVAIGSFLTLQVFWRKRLKKRYFEQNGGTELQKLLLLGARGEESRKLFKVEELCAATNNYSSDMKLGGGGFGTVFKGVLNDGRVVAIKKPNKGVDSRQLLNELEIMVQINHKNIVRFLGCCLETVEPLLVYECVSNGNVMENLSYGSNCVMNWGQRLKVAQQTAEALAYLHAAAVPPILHRDVKSSNVLLDHNFDAKVADFGGSRLVREGVTHVSTAVQGTLGYLDPEYFQSLQLTEKSDVYSMGVMLVELITGLKPVDNHNREPCFANLALLFIHYMSEGKVEDIIDPRLHIELIHVRSSILAVAALAFPCLSVHGSQRPVMSHVGEELHRIMYGASTPLLQAHDGAYHRTSFGAVVATDLLASIQRDLASTIATSSISIDSSLLDCTMPR